MFLITIKDQTCCFTGHRVLPRAELPALKTRLEETVEALVQSGVRYFGCGGALGFDTLAAQTVLKLRRRYPYIRLILVLPCADQAQKWRWQDRALYEQIKRNADKVVLLAEHYTSSCMLARNRHLVDHSGLCVCYVRRPGGGAAYTARYARQQGLKMIEL